MASPAGTPVKINKVSVADLAAGTLSAVIELQPETNTLVIYAPEVEVGLKYGVVSTTIGADLLDAQAIIHPSFKTPNARRGWSTTGNPGLNTHVVVRGPGASVAIWVEEYTTP